MSRKPELFAAPRLGDLLTDEDRVSLREKARDRVAAKIKEKQEAELLKQYEKEYERELNDNPNEEYRRLLIDLPGHAPNLKIDSQYFYHGREYEVKASVYDQLVEQMQRCWRHENEIGGANRDAYSAPARHGTFGPADARGEGPGLRLGRGGVF